ncbi:MAG: hypothetical protein V1790_10275 [Planctomycetota bacterium]
MSGELLGDLGVDAASRQVRNVGVPQGMKVGHTPIAVEVRHPGVVQVGAEHFRGLSRYVE